MKKVNIFSVLLFIVLFFNNSFSQWILTSGPASMNNSGIIAYQGNLFLTSNKGIFKSSDNGNTWQKSVNGIDPSNLAIIKLRVVQNQLYAVTYSGLYKSTNSGINWTFLSSAYNFQDIAEIGGTLFSCYTNQIYKSTNGGFNWQVISSSFDCSFLFVNGNALFACDDEYAGSLFRSTNSGLSWVQLTNGIPVSTSFYCLNIKDNVIYAGCRDYILKSSDNGDSWQTVNSGLPSGTFKALDIAVNGSTIYAALTDGLYSSVNNGSSWQLVSNYFKNLYLENIVIQNSNIFAVTRWCILKSTNNGSAWLQLYNGLPYAAGELETDGNNLYLTQGHTYTGEVHYSTDFGINWKNFYAYEAESIAFAGINYFLGTFSDDIYKSNDAGISWIKIGIYPYPVNEKHTFHEIAVINQNTILAAGYKMTQPTNDHFIKTTDGGNNWINIPSVRRFIYGLEVIGNNVFVSRGNFGTFNLLRSTDAGDSFLPILVDTITNAMCIIGKYNNTLYAAFRQRGIYKSSNNGSNWISVTGNIPSKNFEHIAANQNNILITSDSLMYRSTNNGVSWHNYTIGLPANLNYRFQSLKIIGNYAFVSYRDTGGVWRANLDSVIGINSISEIIPETFLLYQNYPNPFNPSTKINFDIPIFPLNKGGQRGLSTTLKVFDILGRETATLVNERLAPGKYSVDWDASAFTSGVYFYRLSAGDYTETKRMLIIK